MTSSDRHQSLHGILNVVDALEGGEKGVSEIARELGIAKSGVYKILRNLESRGWVRSTPVGRYRLGLRLWQLGTEAVADLSLREVGPPVMEKLTHMTGEGTLLSVYDAGDVVYLEKVSSPQPVVVTTRIGGRSPAFCTATGKAILAFLPDDEIDAALVGPLERFNEKTVIEPHAIRADLEIVRQRGFALNFGAWRGQIFGVAAPIRDHDGKVVAALGLSGPAYRFGDAGIEGLAPDVMAAADDVSRLLGWNG